MKTIGHICLMFFLLSCCGKCWAEPSYQGKTLSAWLDDYGAGPKNYKPSPQADEAIRQIGPEAVPYLLQLLYATNSPATVEAMRQTQEAARQAGMGWFVSKASSTTEVSQATIPSFVPASWLHWKAYLGVQALGPLGNSAIPDLVKLAHDSSDNSNPSGTGMAPNVGFWKDTKNVAMFAGQSSTYLGPGQSTLNRDVRRNVILVDGEIAAWSLAAIGADSVPPLMELLANPTPRLRCRAAVALGLIGRAAEPAVPALIKMLNDPDINTRWEVTDALGCIGRRSDIVVPALIEALTDSNVGMKFTAMRSLGDFRERATNAIPALLALFPESDMRLGNEAASALIKISRDTTEKEVQPFLLHRIKDSPYPYVRYEAEGTLAQMKDEPDLAIPPLIEALDDTNDLPRNAAIYGLGTFGSAAKSAVPRLVSLTTNQNSNVCRLAIAALGEIDPAWQASQSK